LLLIPCLNGHICPWGENLLAACTSSRGTVAKRLVAAGCEVVMEADDGINATFPIEAFDEIAEIMRPRKRRRLSPEHFRKLQEGSQPHRFCGSQSPQNDLERPISASVDVRHHHGGFRALEIAEVDSGLPGRVNC
ncbi:MAG: hypothetical protein QGF59_25265, partial [Pirellulaceae bacterium]|nr:hypothetical protein [Pirellulaceae bacterium]